MWLNKLKIAIVQKDTDALEKLLEELPAFNNIQEIESVLFLLEEAKNMVGELREDVALSMQKIKKNIEFLRSTEQNGKNGFDVRL